MASGLITAVFSLVFEDDADVCLALVEVGGRTTSSEDSSLSSSLDESAMELTEDPFLILEDFKD